MASSAIGGFIIGVSTIDGQQPGVIRWQDTIMSQYANSPILLALIESQFDAINPAGNIQDFYDKVWNILTAQGWGLDVWGRIVGVSRVLTLPATDYFGFKQASEEPFGQAPLYAEWNQSTTNYILSDDAFRVLILTKALSNISNSAIPTYNKILMQLFPGRGNAFVTDTGNMTERLTFQFPLQPFEIAILRESGAFTAPTGVELDILIADPANTFGFKQGGYATLGHGTLFPGVI